MKINFKEPLCSSETRKRLERTLIFAMRTSIFYMAIVIFSMQFLLANHEGKGQAIDSIYVTLSEKESLRTLFEKIQKQTPFRFTYYEDQVDEQIPLPMNKMSVKEVLDLVTRNTDLAYFQVGQHIIVKEQINVNPKRKERFGARVLQTTTEEIHTISGTVTDASSLKPLPGVNIIVKGSLRGTTTDAEGRYALEATASDILVFSYVGYKTIERLVDNSSIIDISLEEDVASLEAVTVNAGYYTTTDKMKTGSIVKVSAKDIENQPVTSPLMALQGRVPGLEIIPNNGTPGNAPTIRIRGINSLRNVQDGQNGNYPLYIIDGLPIDSRPVAAVSVSFMTGGFDPLSTINPANIESIEVLKDADATAIYGSRGANGVILITTKQGAKSGRSNFDISVYRGVGKVVKKLDLLSSQQYLDMRKEAYANDGIAPSGSAASDLIQWDTTRSTDWQDVLIGGTSNITDVQGSVTGGSTNTSFRFGGGYHKETLVLPGDFFYQRASSTLSLNHSSTDQRFKITLSLNYGLSQHKLFDDANFVPFALTLPPVAPPIYDENGDLNWAPRSNGRETWTNPFSFLKKSNVAKSSNLIANGSMNYEIVPRLKLKANFGYTDLNTDEITTSPIAAMAPFQITPLTTAFSSFGINKRSSWIIEPQLTYEKEIGPHQLDVIIGTTWQESNLLYQSLRATGYTSDAYLGSTQGAGSLSFDIDDNTEYKYAALFARIGYNFKDKYLLNVTGRRDGSSRFGPGKRFGNFGAVGVAWIFSNENLLLNGPKFISFGKVRASYGSTGNDQIGDYQWYETYQIKSYRYQNAPSLSPTDLHNSRFAWEVTHKLETTLELGFFDNRVSLEASWYRNRSSNQLVRYQLPTITGFQSILSNFDATVENSGWEALLNTVNVSTDNLRWTSSINFSSYKNKLIRFDNIEESPYATQYKVGEPLTIQRLYISKGVNPETGMHEVEDTNEDGFINDDDKRLMNVRELKFYGGISNSLKYKSFELSFLFQFAKRHSTKYMPAIQPGRNNHLIDVLDRWQQEGDVTKYQKFTTMFSGYLAYVNASQSDYNVQDASFIRLKTLSLSYRIPGTLMPKTKIQEARVYLQGQNLFTLTNFVGLDPETGSFSLPPLKIVTIGFQLKF